MFNRTIQIIIRRASAFANYGSTETKLLQHKWKKTQTYGTFAYEYTNMELSEYPWQYEIGLSHFIIVQFRFIVGLAK